MSQNLDQLAADIKQSLDPAISSLKEAVKQVVHAVEKIAKDTQGLSSTDKQQLASKVLEEYVNVPFPLSLFKGVAIRFLIERAVAEMNK